MEWEEKRILPQDEPDNGKRKKVIIILAVVILAAALIGLGIWAAPYVVPVEQVTTQFTYELGQDVSRDITDYVTGRDWAVAKSTLDISQVQADTVGEYPVMVRHGFQRFEYIIRIQDTTAPVLTLEGGPYVLELGESYGVDFFDIEVQDYSEHITMGIGDGDGMDDMADSRSYGEELSYDSTGYRQVAISATDASGNTGWMQLDVLVDDGPEIEGVKDFYLAVGAQPDYFAGITSVDEVDGDLTAALAVDVTAVDYRTPGVYQVTYSNEDQFGFDTRVQAAVHVMEVDALQTAINTHAINRREDTIIGALNLYDSGYYAKDDVKFIMAELEPVMVGISLDEVSWGSGFVIEINEQEMILCTNQHVVKDYRDVTVHFHNGASVTGSVAGADYNRDIAFVTIPVAALPESVTDTMMTVHINRTYWEGLENEAAISLCMRTINRDGSIWRDRTGKLISKDGELPEGVRYREVSPITEVSVKLYSGCSGSAILDGHGNLIAMAAGHSDARYYAIPLGNILDYFEQVFGREVYYE